MIASWHLGITIGDDWLYTECNAVDRHGKQSNIAWTVKRRKFYTKQKNFLYFFYKKQKMFLAYSI